MTALTHHLTRLPRVPLAVLLLTVAIVAVGQVLPRALPATRTPVTVPAAAADGVEAGTEAEADAGAGGAFDPLAPAGAVAATDDLVRIRANVTFWGDRFAASPRDFVSATRLAASDIELARATGDVTAYAAADAAIDGALAAYPDYALALDYRGVVQVALHRFSEARAQRPVDPRRPAGRSDSPGDAR